ncbi:transcription factor [Elasticomyces elasticus]|uniref:Transcription factor n=1 Tax=Elasticomyces elasticus TaxID=574655 RepID=A0AAN7W388_9PEZI|nr:transcription factor [Elasticomyces elasticus]
MAAYAVKSDESRTPADVLDSPEDQLPFSSSSRWAQDLHLLAHFISHTSKTLSFRQDMLCMWQNQVPKDFVHYPFLAHGVLAIAALHLAALDKSRERDYSLSYHLHMSKGIRAFREALAKRDGQFDAPCFAMAHLLAADSLASISDNAPQDCDGSTSPLSLETILRLIVIVRGFQNITLQVEGSGDGDGDPTKLPYGVDPRFPEEAPPSLPREVISEFAALRDRIIQEEDSYESSGSLEALSQLEVLERMLAHRKPKTTTANINRSNDVDPGLFAKWLVTVPEQYVTNLHKRHPLALQVLAGFAKLARSLGHLWYFQNWSSNALKAIQDTT